MDYKSQTLFFALLDSGSLAGMTHGYHMLKSQIESLLFISAKPMSSTQLAEVLKLDVKEVEAAGNELVELYKTEKRGIQIIRNGHKFQMVSSPENAQVVQEFIKDETTGELSRPSLETLTVIAYRGPIAKSDLERIRGVNCSLIIRNLLLRGLVEQKHNKTTDENFYTVTFDFLRFLGVNDVTELPDYEKLHTDEAAIIEQSKTKEAAGSNENGKGSESTEDTKDSEKSEENDDFETEDESEEYEEEDDEDEEDEGIDDED